MSTLAALLPLLGETGIKPWSEGMQSVYQAQNTQTQGQTALLALAEQKRQQEAQALVMERIKNDPALAQQLFGGSTLGALPTAPGGPPGGGPPGAITQSPLGGGPAQQVPAYPDASRYANVSPQGGGPIPPGVTQQVMPTVTPPGGAPQSTIASLAPQPQGQMQAPQNPLLELARRDPRAAMMLQQQMQAQQDRQWNLEEQHLNRGVKVSEYVARMIGSVTDQATLDDAREAVRLVHPQAAAQIPQMYNKEAIEALQQKGIAVANLAAWHKDEATARRTDLMTQRLPETMQKMRDFVTGDGGGTQETPPAPAPGARQPAAAASPEIESAINEAHRLYPQVPIERIRSIIAADSNFDPKAVSKAGAQGLMQLMPGTSKIMGVDDPFNPAQNVRGGTRYYAQLLSKYGGDDRKALAAYNAGPGAVDAVGGDVSKLPQETQAYVPKVLGGATRASAGGQAGTAQAPPTDPRIAGLEARIKKGQALVMEVANQPGMENQAALLNQQVNDLQKERDKLLEPQQAAARASAVATVEQPFKVEQQEKLGLQTERLKQEAEKNRSLVQVVGEDKAAQYRDRTTGEPLNGAQPYGDALVQVQQNKAIPLSAKQAENLDKIQGVVPTIRELRQAMVRVYGPGGIFDNLKPEDRAAAAVKGGWEKFAQTNPDLAVFARLIESNVDVVRRALQGQVGTQTEQDAVRGAGAFPKTGNIPDSKEVAYKLMDAFENMVQGNMRTILRNPHFTHPDLQPTTTSRGLTPAQEALLKKHTTP